MKQEILTWFQEMGSDVFYTQIPQNRYEEPLLPAIPQPLETVLKAEKGNVINPKFNACDKVLKSKSRELADAATTLDDLYNAIRKFDGCDLKKAAKTTVVGDGAISDVLLIGEAPGAQEDLNGIPFCGQSGNLLDNILKSIDLSRKSNCYITNTVFWRPPGNRRPTPEEIDICRPFVEKHIALIKPKIIILVGSTAVESLLNLKIPMKTLKTQYFDYTNCYLDHKIKTAIILHPSYLLRQPREKKSMWFDILRIKKDLL